jgi:polyphenol oxidase
MPARTRGNKAPPRAASHDSELNSGWTLRPRQGLSILKLSALSRLAGLVHGFSTRPGGVSELKGRLGPGKTEHVLNLGFADWDERARVEQNRGTFAAAIDAAQLHMVTLRQIHSDIVHQITAKSLRLPPTGDAMFTARPGLLLAVQTADCVPILLADPRTGAVAAVHSGWRGTLKRIGEKTLGRLRMEFGTRPEDVVAAVGPGIGGCCYEVGPEVAKEFAAQFRWARNWFAGPFDDAAAGENDPYWLPWLNLAPPGHTPEPRRLHLDLIAANRAILAEAGVPQANIWDSGLCTGCRTDLFFSHRKERSTGRGMAAIGVR